MITVYGITNCTTVQKARNWLAKNQVEYTFHDYKKLGVDIQNLEKWCREFGWQKVLNTKGQMWRKASEVEKAKVVDEKSAIAFMLATPTAIKRPIVEYKGGLLLGFEEDEWEVGLG